MSGLNNPFESPEYLVQWAIAETDSIKAVIERLFLQEDLIDCVNDFDPELGKFIVKAKFKSPIPVELRGMVSNVLKNLRDALDQSTYAATLIIRSKKSNRAHFPFGESPSDLEQSLAYRKAIPCSGLADDLFPVLRTCEPYPTGETWHGGNDNLRKLGRIAGNHKHGITLRVTSNLQLASLGPGVIKVGPGGAELLVPAKWDGENNELHIARFLPGGHFEADAGLSMEMTFGPGPLENTIIIAFLADLCGTVGAIVERIKLETFKIMASKGSHIHE